MATAPTMRYGFQIFEEVAALLDKKFPGMSGMMSRKWSPTENAVIENIIAAADRIVDPNNTRRRQTSAWRDADDDALVLIRRAVDAAQHPWEIDEIIERAL